LKKGEYQSTDQVAIFHGKLVRAGYISNYVFGTTMARLGFTEGEAVAIAQGIAYGGNIAKTVQTRDFDYFGGDGDNDQRGISDGWRSTIRKGAHPLRELYKEILRTLPSVPPILPLVYPNP
jgi:hypothetical protein